MPHHHRHRNQSVTNDPVKVIGIAAIAAAVGATVAMLLTPRSGSQVRGGLRRRAHRLGDSAHDRFVRTIDEAEDATDDAKEHLQNTLDKAIKDAKATTRKVSTDTKAVKTRAKSVAKTATKPRTSRKPRA